MLAARLPRLSSAHPISTLATDTERLEAMTNPCRNIAVIGLGTFGLSIARTLCAMGDKVLIIDKDPAQVSKLSDDVHSAVQADATDSKALEECGLDAYDSVIVSIGEDLEASILAAMNAIELGCQDVWVKAQSEAHQKIMTAIGVQNVVLPEQSFGNRVAQMVHNPHVQDFLHLGGEMYVVEMKVSDALEYALADADFDNVHNVTFLGVHSDQSFTAAASFDGSLNPGAKVLIHGRRDKLRLFADSL